jgi:hypothetical protein
MATDGGYVSADVTSLSPPTCGRASIESCARGRPRVEARANEDYSIIDGFAPMPVGPRRRLAGG